MATLNKDFKIKQGLVVEGATATVGGNPVLTENASDQYIIDLIGGETLVTSVNATQLEVLNGELSVKSGVFDADGAADTAYADAKTYVSNAPGDGLGWNANTEKINVELGSGLNLDQYDKVAIDRTTVDAWYDSNGSAGTAEQNAKDYADALINDASNTSNEVWSAYKTSTEIGLAQSAAEQFATDAVSDLVNGAPALLDTLNELAAALQDNPDVITNIQDVAAGKQDALTAGSNIDITGATISVTGLNAADISDFNSAAVSATSLSYDAAGTAQGLVDALNTDAIEEGTLNRYYTDARAKAEAASLLTNATKTNITITADGSNNLTITAENGVADSTTNDLAEGTLNRYFTDSRAVDAIGGSTIAPFKVEINDYRREEASRISVANPSTATVHSFDYPYESAKYVVRVVGWVSGVKHSQITEILLTTDGSNNIAITEYGTTHTSTEPLATFSAAWSGTYDLTVTTAVAGCEVIAAATLLSWAD